MKKFIIPLLILVFLSSFASALTINDCIAPERSEWLEARHTFDEGRRIIKEAKMDAVIEIALSYGADTTALESIKVDAVALFEGIDTTDIGNYNETMDAIKALLQEFRETARALPELEGHGTEVVQAIEDAVTEVEEVAQAKFDESKAARKTLALAVFDFHTCVAQIRIDALDERGADIEAAQAKLDEITGKRTGLEDVLDTDDREQIKAFYEELKAEWNEFREALRNARKSLVDSKHQELVSRIQDRIEELQGLDVDTSEIEALLGELDDLHTEIQSLLDAGDYDAVRDLTPEIRELIRDIREAIINAFKALKGGGLE